MYDFITICNEYDEITCIETKISGLDLLSRYMLNKGCAFTLEERDMFGLNGLLPTQVETLEQQAARMYMQYNEHQTNLGKNIYLNVLHDYNETLFYKLISDHLEEMLPIIYTPTVGEAVQRFSLEHRRQAAGLYISYKDRDKISAILENTFPQEIDLTVVTDGQSVLGIGDQGIGGINISNAKLMVYTLCGGINPHRVLPICLDVGTNNPHLLSDPMYLGWRHERIDGQAYDDFIDAFVTALTKKWPNIFVHWEDFGRDNARRILTHYRDKILTLNGDMQSTGVIALASVLAGAEASGTPLPQHRIIIFGAGTAGVGIADQIYNALLGYGLSPEKARECFWLIDRQGLLTEDCNMLPFQEGYARKRAEINSWALRNPSYVSLYDVVKYVRPTILIGCSTVAGAFNEEIIKLMAAETERPVILPLSNPNSLSEADPANVYEWTDGKALIATGSPFPDVNYEGRRYRIAQSNNALAFPGIGLGAIAVGAKHVTDGMLWAATKALAIASPVHQDRTAPLLPRVSDTRLVSKQIAFAVAQQAITEGLSNVPPHADLASLIQSIIWEPKYYPYRRPK